MEIRHVKNNVSIVINGNVIDYYKQRIDYA